jgi:hypothetical protein
MPLKDYQVESRQRSREEALEKAHGAVRKALNPQKAVEEMAESDDYEGVAFTATEVWRHVEKQVRDSSFDNPQSENDYDSDENNEGTWADEKNQTLDYLKEEMDDPSLLEKVFGNNPTGLDAQAYIREELSNSNDVVSVSKDGDNYFTEDQYLD